MASESIVSGTNSATPSHPEAPLKRAPTLYGIIVFKLVKGALFVALAITAYCLSDENLPKEFQSLLHLLRVQPDNRFWAALAAKVGQLTEVKMLWTAAGTLVYSLFALVEGIGMMFRVSWAGWLAIGESAFFIPLELYELIQKFSWSLSAVLVINIVIVWYLFENRHRLFRHHLHH
jgi:uncharacterized membrane protein (DUF2068 family)